MLWIRAAKEAKARGERLIGGDGLAGHLLHLSPIDNGVGTCVQLTPRQGQPNTTFRSLFSQALPTSPHRVILFHRYGVSKRSLSILW
jgi:hypothetical protein